MSKANNTVQEKLAKLSGMVEWFQSPDFTLEEAVVKYQEAEVLAEEIEKGLASLKNDIQVIKKRFDSD